MDGFWISLLVCVITLVALLQLVLGLRHTRQLADMPDALPAKVPRLSIIVSALDEEATIEPAMRSLLAADYPELEVIALDDRSRDRTGAILDALAAEDPRLRVIHIRELPAGWIGKNHALHVGAGVATGEYLLFTDADVLFERRALRQAIAYAESSRLDHLVVFAEFLVREHLLAALLLNFYSFAFVRHAPWRVRSDPAVYIGMGAFNLVRADAYRRCGGHVPLQLEVVDDLMLGRNLKAAGCSQDVLMGRGSVMVEWYPGTLAMARGLEKNSLAMVDYSLLNLAFFVVAVLLARGWPLVGLFLTTGATFWINVATVAALLLAYLRLLRMTRWSAHCLWWWPVAPILMIGIVARGALLTLWRGSVGWRGTWYPLAALRQARRDARRVAVEAPSGP